MTKTGPGDDVEPLGLIFADDVLCAAAAILKPN
jgi:hypothetical protein